MAFDFNLRTLPPRLNEETKREKKKNAEKGKEKGEENLEEKDKIGVELKEVLQKLSIHLLPPDPIVLPYTIRLSGDEEIETSNPAISGGPTASMGVGVGGGGGNLNSNLIPGMEMEGELEPVPTCFDIVVDKPEAYNSNNNNLYNSQITNIMGIALPTFSHEKELYHLEEKVQKMLGEIEAYNRRREFLLAFSESPLDVVNMLISQQGREIKIPGMDGELDGTERRNNFYHSEWLPDAVDRFLDARRNNNGGPEENMMGYYGNFPS